MRRLSLLMFAGALVLGLLSVMFARNIVNAQRAKPIEVSQTAGESIEMGTLVVAAAPLNFGDEITVESLKVVPWPLDPEVRPENSFSDISEIMTADRRVAIRSMGRNEPVVQDKISGFGYRATLSQIVAADMRAAAIRINDVTGVGGFVLPGDRVDVLMTIKNGDDAEDTETRLIVRDVRVLAIDQVADESSEGAVVAKAATLEVSQEQAQKLSLAARVGQLDLALRPMMSDGTVIDKASETIEVADLINDNALAEQPETKPVVKARAYTPLVRKAKAAPKPDPFSTMTVTRGIETTESEVLREDEQANLVLSSTTLAGSTTSSPGSYQPNP